MGQRVRYEVRHGSIVAREQGRRGNKRSERLREEKERKWGKRTIEQTTEVLKE